MSEKSPLLRRLEAARERCLRATWASQAQMPAGEYSTEIATNQKEYWEARLEWIRSEGLYEISKLPVEIKALQERVEALEGICWHLYDVCNVLLTLQRPHASGSLPAGQIDPVASLPANTCVEGLPIAF